ncbi:MAG: CatB-related O-acetyltransferase [Candidatus Shapirobacteria bacterium]|nr:CatB-related O-acetyltransferase [Candidatus Shapirobacteria bacterium]
MLSITEIKHKSNYYLFHIFSKLPLFLKYYISKIRFQPKIDKGSTIYGYTVFGPNVSIGEYSYLHSPARLTNITIGKFCSIAQNFATISHRHKYENFFNYKFNNETNSPFSFKYYKEPEKVNITKPITIGDDVYIGYNVTILGGVKIGNGSIIAANSLVNKDIPPYTIYGGVPAKFIKNKKIKNKEIKNFNFNQKNYLTKLEKLLKKLYENTN